jgi:hypothetical protein
MFAFKISDLKPDSVDDIRHLKEVFDDSIVSIIKYGFGKRNILVVVNDTSVEYLTRIRPFLLRISRDKNIVVISKNNIMNKNMGIDFLNIKLTAAVIYGENVLEHLKFEKENLRNQVIYEANKILINTRHDFLSKRWGWQRKNVLFQAVPRILPLIVAHLYLADQKIPNAIPDTINRYLKVNEDAAVLLKISRNVSTDELPNLFTDLFALLENIGDRL